MFRPSALPPRPPKRTRIARVAGRTALALVLPALGLTLVWAELSRGAAPVGDADPITEIGPADVEQGDEEPSRDRAQRELASRSAEAVARGGLDDEGDGSVVVLVELRGVVGEWETTAETVGGALEEIGFSVGEHDVVEPPRDAEVHDGLRVVIRRVEYVEEVATEALPHDVVERETDEREQGERVVVQEGADGLREVVEEVRVVDGVEAGREVVDERVDEPVDEVVEVGTAPPPEPEPPDDVDGGVWDQLAQCESSGNWSANTGNGFYGGLQFLPETWAAFGGREYAPNAHEASRAEQIAVAERVLAAQGWSAWPSCSSQLGLR